MELGFEVIEKTSRDGKEVFAVNPPSCLKEKLIPLNTDGTQQLAARMGAAPVRASLCRWRKNGYPVVKDGPRVLLPHTTSLKRVNTSVRALHQFMQVVQNLQEQIQEAGSVDEWRSQRKKRRKGK